MQMIEAKEIPEDTYIQSDKETDPRIIIKKNENRIYSENKHHLVNKDGKIIFTCDQLRTVDIYRKFYVAVENKSYGVVNRDGNIIIPIKFQHIFDKRSGVFSVWEDDGLFYEYDKEGQKLGLDEDTNSDLTKKKPPNKTATIKDIKIKETVEVRYKEGTVIGVVVKLTEKTFTIMTEEGVQLWRYPKDLVRKLKS